MPSSIQRWVPSNGASVNYASLRDCPQGVKPLLWHRLPQPMTSTVPIDAYILDTLMRDLVGHDRQPSAFLVYLF
jgi:hypothetical protein